jgi:predicted nucleic acid-binding protein
MATKTEAYVDTSALIAFADGSDTFHALFRRLFADPTDLVTTTLVVAEWHGWFLRRFDSSRAFQFLAMVESMRPVRVLGVSTGEQDAGTELLRKYSDQVLTMADAAGLHVMEKRHVKTCWSTDFHLGLTGVQLVIHL